MRMPFRELFSSCSCRLPSSLLHSTFSVPRQDAFHHQVALTDRRATLSLSSIRRRILLLATVHTVPSASNAGPPAAAARIRFSPSLQSNPIQSTRAPRSLPACLKSRHYIFSVTGQTLNVNLPILRPIQPFSNPFLSSLQHYITQSHLHPPSLSPTRRLQNPTRAHKFLLPRTPPCRIASPVQQSPPAAPSDRRAISRRRSRYRFRPTTPHHLLLLLIKCGPGRARNFLFNLFCLSFGL